MLIRTIGLEPARNLYGSLETLLHWDYHYWLQRGSTEVERGDLSLAEHFLNQARSLNPDDSWVSNEWAYLLFSKAISNPASAHSVTMIQEAVGILEDLIGYDRANPYPYHVLGAQGLTWARRGISSPREKGDFLTRVIEQVQAGANRFPADQHIREILKELKREYLNIAVPTTPRI